MSLADKILKQSLQTVSLYVPEWGETVILRELDGFGRITFEKAYSLNKDNPDEAMLMGLSAALSIVDPHGERVFTDDQIPELQKQSGKALRRVYDAFLDLNIMSDTEVDDTEKK